MTTHPEAPDSIDGFHNTRNAVPIGLTYQDERPFYYHRAAATVSEDSEPARDQLTSPLDQQEDQVVFSYPFFFDDYTLY